MPAQSQDDSGPYQATTSYSSSSRILPSAAGTADHQRLQVTAQSSAQGNPNAHNRNAETYQIVSSDSDRRPQSPKVTSSRLPAESLHEKLQTTPASPKNVETRDRSTLSGRGHSISTDHLDNHRAKLAMVTKSAESTQQELQEKLDDLKDLLPANSSAVPTSPSHNPARMSFGRAPQAINGLNLTQAQTLDRAQQILDNHVATLSRYNEIKDTAMEMLGFLAEQKGMTMKEIMADKGIDEAD